MKKVSTKTIHILLLSFFFVFSAAHAQKIPFQGQLLENDAPANGPRNFVFSIAGTTWTETQNGVAVNNGLYSVVLGSVTPLPADLFSGVDSRQLNITVNNQALTPLTIYPAMASNSMSLVVDAAPDGKDMANFNLSGLGTAGKLYRSLLGTSAVSNGFNIGVTGVGTGAGVSNVGIRGLAYGPGDGSTGYNTGSYNNGVQGFARSNNWGNTGVYGWVYNDPNLGGIGVDNNGVVGRSEVNNGTPTIQNTGVRGDAKGSGINKGIVGMASGGAENWAGWFDGNVKVTGNLDLSGNLGFDKTIENVADAKSLNVKISGTGSNGATYSGIYSLSEATNANAAAIRGEAIAKANNSNFTYGTYGVILPDQAGPSTGVVYAARGDVANGVYNAGAMAVRGLTTNTSNVNNGFFTNTGGYFDARNNPVINAGVYAQAINPQNAGTSTNYGIYAKATGGAQNWAGWFEGDTKVNGILNANELRTGAIAGSSLNANGNDGEVNVVISGNWLNGGDDGMNRGLITLFGGVAERNTNGGVDIRRVDLAVADDGLGKSVGKLSLYGPVAGFREFVRLQPNRNSDGTGYFGELELKGQTTQNITLGAKSWEADGGVNRPYFTMKGNQTDQAPGLVWFHINKPDGASTMETAELNLGNSDGTHQIRMYGKLAPNSTSHISLDGANGNHIYLWGNGGAEFTGNINGTTASFSGAVTQNSDRRLKSNIKTLSNSLNNVVKLRGVNYTWSDPNKSQKLQIGLIAQEVEGVYPEFVTTDDKGIKSVNYSQMVAVLIESIKELNNSIEALKSENQTLKAELTQSQSNAKKIAELEQTMQSLLTMMKSTTTREAEQGSASGQDQK